MIRLILKRIALSVPLVIVVTMLTFVLNNMAPGDMAATLLQGEGSNAQYEELRVKLGLDRPVLEQYGDWLGSAAQGDLGKSFFTGESVVSLLNQRFWVSFSLVIGALILCVSVGISLGLVSALRGGFIARAVDVVSVAALIFPSFWVAIVLMSVFSVWLRWLPAVGYTPLTENPRLWFLGLILPVISVALHSITTIAKQTRDSMGDTMNRDFIRSLRACGIPERAIIPVADDQSVYVVEESVVRLREVETGGRRPGIVEVVSGISEGDRIVTDGVLSLRDGATIEIAGEYEGPSPGFDPTATGTP